MHEPLYAVYRRSILPNAENILASNGRKIIQLLDGAKVKFIEFQDQGWYQNLNVKDDYLQYVKKKTSEKLCNR